MNISVNNPPRTITIEFEENEAEFLMELAALVDASGTPATQFADQLFNRLDEQRVRFPNGSFKYTGRIKAAP